MTRALNPHERKFYVYVFFRPHGSPLYVGKGCGNRWKQHLRQTEKGAKGSNALLRRELVKASYDLPVVKIREGLTNDEANDLEFRLIKIIGRGRLGPLVNKTDGGDGCVGLKKTEAHKRAIGAKSKGRRHTPEMVEKFRAMRSTPEWREAQSKRALAQHANMTDEQRVARSAKISERTKAAMTPERCKIISEKRAGKTRPPTRGNTGQKWTSERRAIMEKRIEERKAAGWHSEETKRKIGEAHLRNSEARRNNGDS